MAYVERQPEVTSHPTHAAVSITLSSGAGDATWRNLYNEIAEGKALNLEAMGNGDQTVLVVRLEPGTGYDGTRTAIDEAMSVANLADSKIYDRRNRNVEIESGVAEWWRTYKLTHP